MFENDRISVLIILKDQCQILISCDPELDDVHKTVTSYFRGVSNATSLKLYNPCKDWNSENHLSTCVEFLICIEQVCNEGVNLYLQNMMHSGQTRLAVGQKKQVSIESYFKKVEAMIPQKCLKQLKLEFK